MQREGQTDALDRLTNSRIPAISLTSSEEPLGDYFEMHIHSENSLPSFDEMLTEAASFTGADPPALGPPRTLLLPADSPTVGDEPDPVPAHTMPQTVEPRSFFKAFLPH